MSVFYRGPHVLITEETFEVEKSRRYRYLIAAMTDPRIVRADPPPADRTGRAMGVSALVGAAVAIPLVGPASRLLAGLLILVLGGCAALHLRRSDPVRWHLVADYEGSAITLFSSTDRTEFEQVCRGLQRCLEQRESRL